MRAIRFWAVWLALGALAGCVAEAGEQEDTSEVEHPLDPVLSLPVNTGPGVQGAPGDAVEPGTPKPTPDPWRGTSEETKRSTPTKPTPDPWTPGAPSGGAKSEAAE